MGKTRHSVIPLVSFGTNPAVGSSGASIAAGTLAGRGSASGAGVYQQITLGTNLSMAGTTLNASGGGAGSYTISTKTAAYTEVATSGEVVALLDLAAGFTVTLPTAVGNTAKLVYKKMLAAGSMVIDANGAQTIDGGLTATLTNQYESITLYSDNANWIIA